VFTDIRQTGDSKQPEQDSSALRHLCSNQKSTMSLNLKHRLSTF